MSKGGHEKRKIVGRVSGSILALAALQLTAVGCGGSNRYQEPDLPQDQVAILRSEAFDTTHVDLIDGQSNPKPAYGLFEHGDVKLMPGVHTLVARFNDRQRYSVHRGEITFAAVRRTTYRVIDWPPKVVDANSKAAVPQKLRMFD